jgi:hypothetical protein
MLIFVLSMEVTTLLINRVIEHGLLSPIGNCTATQRVSIYADDVVLFVKPTILYMVFKLHINYRNVSNNHTRRRSGRGNREKLAAMQNHMLPHQIHGTAS